MKIRDSSFTSSIKQIDFILVFAVLGLTFYGIICISSATRYLGTAHNTIVQSAAALIGVTAMIILSLIDYDLLLKKLWIFIFIGGLVLLVIPLLFGGRSGSNANWFPLPFVNVNVQPSEIVKVTFTVSFGYLLGHLRQDINNWKSIIMIAVLGGSTILFVLIEKDLGAAIVFIIVFFIMCFFAKMSVWYLGGTAAAALALAPFIWSRLDDYQQKRILVGFNPELDPEDKGYQVLQTMRAIRNGGVTGMGYGNGTLSQAETEGVFPARETDVILGVMGEEFGFIGIMVYLVLITVVIVRILKIARQSRHEYGSYICVGIASILIFQTVENIFMCLGMLPVIGLTLPFISYGGSSIVGLYLCIGVVLSIKTHRQKYFFEREKV